MEGRQRGIKTERETKGGQKFNSHETTEELRESWKEKRHREVRMDGWRKRGKTCWDLRWCQSAADGSES